ncbi:MAG: MobA/MobL family protein [Acidobacteria bacterium]|nr:MobA/MobL family protein [Acidobacteriota bacterium]
MAIGHLAVRSHTRSKGHSAAAAVAYRCATRVVDERTGELHDYSRRAVRGDVVESSLTAGPWSDAQAFATAIETAERRKNSMILRDVQPAIPSELGEADQVALTADFAAQLAARYGTQTLWAVHRPHIRGDRRNSHAHIVLPTRRLNDAGDGFGKKLRELDCKPQSSVEVKAIRQLWETTANRYLARAKSPARVDCGRRPDGDPMPTLGPVATGLERRARPDEPPQPVTELVTDSAEEPVTDAGRALAQVMLERRAREDERSRKKTTALPVPASHTPLLRPAFAPAAPTPFRPAASRRRAVVCAPPRMSAAPAPIPRARTRAVAVCTPCALPPLELEQRITVLQQRRRDHKTRETRPGPRVPLVELLVRAAHDGGARLSRARSDFERMDAADGLKRLVLTAVDPELLEAVVGPRLASTWVEPLRVQYGRFKQAYPADWREVEKVWREQRDRWRPQHQARATRAETPPRPTPERPTPTTPLVSCVRQEPTARERPTPPYRAASRHPAAVCAPLRRQEEHQSTLRRVATRERAVCAPLRVPIPAHAVHRAQTRAAAVCTRPVPEQRIEDLQHQLDREQAHARKLEFRRQLKRELPRALSDVDGRLVVSNRTVGSLIQMLDGSDQTDAAARQVLKGLRADKRSVATERAAAERQHHKAAYDAEIAKRQAGRWVALSREERDEAFKSVVLASLPALVEKIRAVCKRVLERVFRAQSTPTAATPTPSWKDKVKSAVGIGDTPEQPPRPPSPAAGAAEAAQKRARASSMNRPV